VSRTGGYGKVLQLVKRPQELTPVESNGPSRRQTSEFKDYLAKNMPLVMPAPSLTGAHSPVNLSGQYITLQDNEPQTQNGNSQTDFATHNTQLQYPDATHGITGGAGVVEKENVFTDVFADILKLNS